MNDNTTSPNGSVDYALMDLLVEQYPDLDDVEILKVYQQQIKDKSQQTLALITGHITNQTKQILDHALSDDIPAKEISQTSYRIEKRLDSGGQSDVFLAYRDDGNYQQTVVIKRLHKSINSREDRDQLLLEMQLLADLKHINIVTLHDGGIGENKQPWMLLEFIDGLHIDAYFEQYDLSVKEQLQMLITLANALDYVHQQGIFHLDIKPSNIMVELVGGEARPVLIDFGIAIGSFKDLESQGGTLMATPAFAAPEQLQLSEGELDQRTDVYSFGKLIECLMPQVSPYSGKDFQAILKKCTQINPVDRYQSMSAVSNDLNHLLTGQAVSVNPLGVWTTLKRAIQNKPARFLGLAVVTFLVLLIGVILVEQKAKLEQHTELSKTSQNYNQQVNEIRSAAQLMYVKPTHNIETTQRTLISQLLALSIDADEKLLDIDHFLLAATAFQLNQHDTAQKHLEQALLDNPENTQAMVLKAKNHLNIYRVLAEQALQESHRERRAMKLQQLREKWINPAIDLLNQAQQLGTDDAFLVTMIDMITSDQEETAFEPLLSAQDQPLWPVEQSLLAAQILVNRAENDWLKVDKESAKNNLNQAFELFQQAHDLARSDPNVAQQWCSTEALVIKIDVSWHQNLNGGCELLKRLFPTDEQVTLLLADMNSLKAQAMMNVGQNPLTLIHSSQNELSEVEMVNSAEKFRILGQLTAIESKWASVRGENSQVLSQQAIRFLRNAAKLKPDYYDIQMQLADALYSYANSFYALDTDADAMFSEAVTIYKQLSDHPKADVFHVSNLVKLLTDQAYRRYQISQSPESLLQQAEQILAQVNSHWKDNKHTLSAKAYFNWTFADFLALQNRNPEPYYSQAVKYYRQDLNLRASHWSRRYNFISLMMVGVNYRLNQELSQQAEMAAMKKELDTLAEQVDEDVKIDGHWGYYYNLMIKQAAISGQSVAEWIHSARSYNHQALDIPIDRYTAFTQLATTVELILKWSPEQFSQDDLTLIEAGLAEFPEHHELRAQYAQLLYLISQNKGVKLDGIEGRDLLDEVNQQLTTALNANSLLANRFAPLAKAVNLEVNQNRP